MGIRPVARALMVIGCVLASAGAQADTIGIAVLSSQPGLVSGGNALVAVSGDGPVTLNGADVTAAFKSGSGGERIGLVEGLKLGANILKGGGASLILTNHPINGPVFSGPHEMPFYCMTDKFALPASKADKRQCREIWLQRLPGRPPWSLMYPNIVFSASRPV